MRAEEVWFGSSPSARLLRGLLTPASWLYGAGFLGYRALYDLGIKRAYRAPIPVVCVGNLTVGGSGKTPTTLHVADVVRELGYEPIVGASGYGSPRSEGATLAPPGPLDPREWGDEPTEMRWLRPDLPLVVGRRRALAGRLAGEAFPQGVLVMDDGFQHLPADKDVTILLNTGGGNQRCLPAGPYREPHRSLKRADLVLRENFGVFRIYFLTEGIFDPAGECLHSGDVGVVTAIARPERLLAAIESLDGFSLGPTVLRPDHDPLDAPDLLAPFAPGSLILTTAKDWGKLSLRADAEPFRFGIVRREARIDPPEEFRAWLKERIERV